MKRYALLDTDFISKTYSVQDDGGNHLIDRVMELPEYEFFCHAQIVTELNRYNADAPIWLSEKVGAQKIKSYTDQEILESLSLVRGPLACATYTQMLKLACDAFSKDYFSEHYRALEEADYTVISREDYLKKLERLDIEVGKKNNLGEIKSFVLLQVLSVMLGEQIYVFCSDDKNARNGATNFEDLPQKTGRNERTGDCRAAEQRERAASQRVQTAVWSELSQWVQSWHSCKVAGDSGASDSKK